jgi:hypothetical protein
MVWVQVTVIKLTPSLSRILEIHTGRRVSRLGLLLVRLPPTVIESFNALDPAAAGAMVEELRRDAVTPLRQLKLLELLCAGEKIVHTAMVDTLVREIIPRWRPDAGAFNAVLRWSERVWQRDVRWNGLVYGHRLALVWAHADRVLSTFAAQGVESGFVEERFETLHRSAMRDVLPFDAGYESDAAAPRRMSMEALLLYGLNAALGAQSDLLLKEHRETFMNLITLQTEHGPFPLAGLFADRSHGSDTMGTFFSARLDPWYSEPIVAGGIPLLTDAGREEMRTQVIRLLKTEPASLSGWMQVAMLGLQWLPIVLRAEIEESLERFRFAATDEDATRTAQVLATIVPFCGPRVRDTIEPEVMRWARTQAKVHSAAIVGESTDTPADRAAVAVMELAFAVARTGDLRQTLAGLDRVVRSLVRAWPALATRLRDIVTRALRECTTGEGEDLWSAFVTLRALR